MVVPAFNKACSSCFSQHSQFGCPGYTSCLATIQSAYSPSDKSSQCTKGLFHSTCSFLDPTGQSNQLVTIGFREQGRKRYRKTPNVNLWPTHTYAPLPPPREYKHTNVLCETVITVLPLCPSTECFLITVTTQFMICWFYFVQLNRCIPKHLDQEEKAHSNSSVSMACPSWASLFVCTSESR